MNEEQYLQLYILANRDELLLLYYYYYHWFREPTHPFVYGQCRDFKVKELWKKN